MTLLTCYLVLPVLLAWPLGRWIERREAALVKVLPEVEPGVTLS